MGESVQDPGTAGPGMKPGSWYDQIYFDRGAIKPLPAEKKSNYATYTRSAFDFQGQADKLIERFVSPRRKTPLKALDVGCAKGFLVEALRERGVDAYGVDISEYALQHAPEEIKPYLALGDMRALPFEDRSFDLVVCRDTLEHATEDQIRQILSEFKRVLKRPHGKIFAVVNTGEYPRQAAGGDKSHNLIRPLSWWEELFEEMGIKGEVHCC